MDMEKNKRITAALAMSCVLLLGAAKPLRLQRQSGPVEFLGYLLRPVPD